MRPLFGPAGNSESFRAAGYKTLMEVPEFLKSMHLDAYEYQGGHGIRISKASAVAFGEKARAAGIALSVHAPYYISLSGEQEEIRRNSIRYILDSAKAAEYMGADRVVVHSGSCGKMPRETALELACDTLSKAIKALDDGGLSGIHLCPETMGKINQLGTVEEVLEICKLDERLIPCIDFGHVNARTFGGLRTIQDFEAIFDKIENTLGRDRLKCFHSHFSKIEYTQKGGEKCHLTFDDREFGPDFEPVAELIYKKGCSPTVICESAGKQAEDAVKMKEIYKNTRDRTDDQC